MSCRLKQSISKIEEITMPKFLISVLLVAMPLTLAADFPWSRGKAGVKSR